MSVTHTHHGMPHLLRRALWFLSAGVLGAVTLWLLLAIFSTPSASAAPIGTSNGIVHTAKVDPAHQAAKNKAASMQRKNDAEVKGKQTPKPKPNPQANKPAPKASKSKTKPNPQANKANKAKTKPNPTLTSRQRPYAALL
ncbi:hypothetical protein [Amycolatopsis taiwanensis]|uniref:hypothetical protein n=1 Tax=Amycolatopsis taiwanensis TaxID=342230 RepID=UPI000488931A|nr:hypothetical protein [Amycolatopsis taiwanensis]